MVCPNLKKKAKKKEGTEDIKEEKDDDYRELYDECVKEVEQLDNAIVF